MGKAYSKYPWEIKPNKDAIVGWGYGELDTCLSLFEKLFDKADDAQFMAFQRGLLIACRDAAIVNKTMFEVNLIGSALKSLDENDKVAAPAAVNAFFELTLFDRAVKKDMAFIVEWLDDITAGALWPMQSLHRVRPPLEGIVASLGVPASKIHTLIVMLLG